MKKIEFEDLCNENLIIVCKDKNINISDTLLFQKASDMISNIIKFNYHKEYEKYIKNLEKEGFNEKQITFLHNNSFPKLNYNIILNQFNSNTIEAYLNYILYDFYSENKNPYTKFNNLWEYAEAICFSKYIIDEDWYCVLTDKLCYNITSLIEECICNFNTGSTEKINLVCIQLLMLNKHPIDETLYVYDLVKSEQLIELNKFNDYYLEMEEEIYNNYNTNIIEYLTNYLYNCDIYQYRYNFIKILNIHKILDNKIVHKIDYNKIKYIHSLINIPLHLQCFVDYITETNNRALQDFVLYCYKKFNVVNLHMLKYELDLLNSVYNKDLVIERLNILKINLE